MKSHVYLNPMTPDGKPGEVKEIEYDAGAQQFLAPVSYAENDDVAKLRANVHEARAKLQHAKSRGAGVAEAQSALDDAAAAASTAHYRQQQARIQQRTGSDFGAVDPFSRQSEDQRQFMPVRDYSVHVDEGDYDEADDPDDDALEAQIVAAVKEMELAQSSGAPQAEVLRLAEVVRALREQLQTPLRETDPPRKSHIDQNPGGEVDTGAIEGPFPGEKKLPDSGPAWKSRQAVKTAKSLVELVKAVASAVAAPAAPKKKATKAETKAGWDKHLQQLDAKLAKRALTALYPLADNPPSTAKVTHTQNVCCEGQYKNLCPRCKAKKDAAA